MFAKVIIDNPSNQVDQEFTYKISDYLVSGVQRGMRVKIPFGNSNRIVMGYISEISPTTEYDGDPKEIIEVLDIDPLISQSQWELMEFIKSDTFSPTSRILNLMIPRVFRVKTVKYLTLIDPINIDANLFKLFGNKTTIKYTNQLTIWDSQIQKARKLNQIKISYEADDLQTQRYLKTYYLNPQINYDNLDQISSPIIKDLASYLLNINRPLTKDEIMADYYITEYSFKKAVTQNYLLVDQQLISRVKNRYLNYKYAANIDRLQPVVNTNKAILFIPNNIDEEQQVFFNEINHQLNNSYKVLVVCSDILSSFKYASLIRKHFKISVACLNSSLSDVEIYDYYQELDQYQVYVTTSGYVLYPYQNIGLIWMFNCESNQYVNRQSPYYDLNVIVKKMAQMTSAKLIRHSYAPDLSSYKEAILNHDYLLTCSTIKKQQRLLITDLKELIKEGSNNYLTKQLIKEIGSTLFINKMTLLIHDQKGFSKSVYCRSCGEVIKCPKCRISMQYQMAKKLLICPACYHRDPYHEICPKCFSPYLEYVGVGHESLKISLNQIYPEARIMIIDNSSYDQFLVNLEAISNHQVDIIIATDTFARAILDENIFLVGIINIDDIVKRPLYNSTQLAYNLLASARIQLSKVGKMIIQTFQPEAEFLYDFINQDYDHFFETSLALSEILKTEPLFQVIRLLIKAPINNGFTIGNSIKKSIISLVPKPQQELIKVIGPAYNHSDHLIQLLIKHQLPDLNLILAQVIKHFQNAQTSIFVDKYSKVIS